VRAVVRLPTLSQSVATQSTNALLGT